MDYTRIYFLLCYGSLVRLVKASHIGPSPGKIVAFKLLSWKLIDTRCRVMIWSVKSVCTSNSNRHHQPLDVHCRTKVYPVHFQHQLSCIFQIHYLPVDAATSSFLHVFYLPLLILYLHIRSSTPKWPFQLHAFYLISAKMSPSSIFANSLKALQTFWKQTFPG